MKFTVLSAITTIYLLHQAWLAAFLAAARILGGVK